MEGFLVRIALQELKKDGINIKHYSHDDDGITRSIMVEEFKSAKEYLDIGHSAKNPQMRGFGERSQRDFRTLVKNHHNNPELMIFVITTTSSCDMFQLLTKGLQPILKKSLTIMHNEQSTSKLVG